MTVLNDGSPLSIELCKGPSLPSCSRTSVRWAWNSQHLLLRIVVVLWGKVTAKPSTPVWRSVTHTQTYSMFVPQYICMSLIQCSEPFDELSQGVVHAGSVVCSYTVFCCVEWLLCSTSVIMWVTLLHVCMYVAVPFLSQTWHSRLCGWASKLPTPPLVFCSTLPLGS